MHLIAKLKDSIGLIFYRHGLFCASHPIASLILVFTVAFMCCYPLKNIQSFGSSLEQYKQPLDRFDGLEANAEINEFVEYEKISEKPGWYNRIPIAYIQRIVVKSILNIPKSKLSSINDSIENLKNKERLSKENKLFLIDAFRTPLAQLFELNDFIRNFQSTKDKKSLIGDMCVHVGELTKSDKVFNSKKSSNDFNKHYLPEFNCLYLSPANFWSNNYDEFSNDNDLMQTINDSSSYLKNFDFHSSDILTSRDEEDENTWANFFTNIINHIMNDDFILDEKKSTNLRELLFGVSWSSTLKSLDDDELLFKKVDKKVPQNDTKSIVMTYAITIALKKCDRQFLDEFKARLYEKFEIKIEPEESLNSNDENHIYNLQYTRQSVVYYIPYVLLYFLLFLYIYISVRKIEFVKSKWGLAFAAVAQVIASLLMSIGICSYFGLTPTLNGGEIFPYLIILIGFENIVVLTKSVVSTPFDLDVRYRIALGLKKESWLITKILTFELIIIFFGIMTMVPAIQEFCIFAYVGLLIDFFMQIVYFVTVLSIDIRRMELSDLNRKIEHKQETDKHNGQSFEMTNNSRNGNVTYRGYGKPNSNNQLNNPNHHHHKPHHRNKWYKYLNFLFGKNYANFLTNKSVQFFYFWANTRLVQRIVMLLTALWIILIFYKSLLVVELMRYDVNVKKETVEALLPKGVGFPKLFKDNFQQLVFTSTHNPSHETLLSATNSTSSFDYLKRHFQNLMVKNKNNTEVNSIHETYGSSTISSYNTFESKKAFLLDDQNWQSLSYYHWLTLFAYYNVSLYNRYVAILPQINLFSFINQSNILKYRNKNEIKNYNSFISVDNESKLILENSNDSTIGNIDHLFKEGKKTDSNGQVKYAVFELMAIVIFGIPAIFVTVYILTVIFKFLCSKNYEEWRKSWSTSNIREKYRMIHSKNRKKSKSINEPDQHIYCDRLKEDCSECYSESDSEVSGDELNQKLTKKNSNNLLDSDTRKDELINKIINGQQDEIDLHPYKSINVRTQNSKHEYPLDLITTGNGLFATSDLSNRIKLWTLSEHESDNDLVKELTLTNSVWSMLITEDNQFILLGFSDGQIRLVNLFTNEIHDNMSKDQNGVTHLKELKLKSKNSDSFSLRSSSSLGPTQDSSYKFLIARLSGCLEIISFCNQKLSPLFSLRAHKSPITNLFYVPGGDYLITSGQDYLLKIIKINFSNQRSSSSQILSEKDLKCIFELDDHGDSLITALCIDKNNTINAASGSQDGTIYIWNLFTGERIRVLNDIMNSKLKRPDIAKLELSQNLLISINSDHQMCIFNRTNGRLVREFKFFAPILPSLRHDNGDINFTTDNCLDSISGSFVNMLASGLFGLIRNIIFYNRSRTKNLNELKNDDVIFRPMPSMCLFSKSILITGGCSCLFLWNIEKGELIKKINIKKNHRNSLESYSQMNSIKEIKVIKQCDTRLTLNSKLSRVNKFILVSDYNDAIYVLRIPLLIIQEYD